MAMRVMIAIDGSEHSQKAFDWYMDHAHKENSDIILAHIAEVAVAPSFGFRAGLAIPQAEWDNMVQEQENKMKDLKKKYGDLLKEKGIKYKFRSEEGDPGHHLCSIAKHDNVEMIVMGTRGQGSVRRTVLGSVSDYVLHHAHVPVAICRH